MINIITGINNKIYIKLEKEKNIKIISKNVQYREGILEILEKNNNVEYIIIDENLKGQIKIEELIKKIKNINKKINIIIVLNKKDLIKEEYLLKNKINFIYNNELLIEQILKLILKKNKIISILGNNGTGKTITTIILSEILIKYKNKKILIVEDNVKNNMVLKLYKTKKNKTIKKDFKNNIININKNLDLLNNEKILINNKKDKKTIINQINKIKDNYDYIFIDTQNIGNFKIYKEITSDNILILNPNILEINKIKNFIIKNKSKLKTILNNYNENSINNKILENVFKNKIMIIGKIKNNLKYNLFINNNLDIKYLDKKTINNYFKIIKKI